MAKSVIGAFAKLMEMNKPRYINGRWRKPVVSRKKLADTLNALRSATGEPLFLKPLRDRGNDRPFKLTKWERNKESREEKIAENMRRMPQMIEEHRRKIKEAREKKRKTRTEEEEYQLAIGKVSQVPEWKEKKDQKKKDQKKKDQKKKDQNKKDQKKKK